ncbi:LysR substrate-binding domain-containing protein [Achromobacter ruhlandii]|uniref:LysR substrate-binding domain-containing protein n=1 Tax=Achromobacter ruhlandii TaxID=72557 RepID=UPI000C2693A6|nr:LysR substrate-binding domain-containing protein [Achromobacter ruhlandii]PJM87877.1 transcriptional regulator [Achromobacter ruhlandii]
MERQAAGALARRRGARAGRLLNFTRAADEVGLTPAGAELPQAATDALDGLRRAVGRARRMARGPGHLRLSLEARFATTLAPVASPSLLENGPAIATPRDLAHYPLCHTDRVVDGMAWPDWKAWMAAAGVPGFDDGHSQAFPDSSHVAQAVLDGVAVDLLEPALIEADLVSGRRVRLFDRDAGVAPGFACHLVYPEGNADDRRVAALRAWLREEAGHLAVV